MKTKRYRLDLDSYFLAEKLKKILGRDGVKYTFEKEGDGGEDGIFGHYEIEVSDYMVDTEPIEKYRVVELTVDRYNELVNPPKKDRFSSLDYEYHDMIEEEFEKRLKAKKEEWANSIIESYKKEFDRYIDDKVYEKYSDLLDRFHNDECKYKDLSRLYQAEIEADREYRLDVMMDKIMKMSDRDSFRYGREFKDRLRRLLSDVKEAEYYFLSDSLYEKIRLMKNDFVDIVAGKMEKIIGKGDYFAEMRRRGRIADFLENAMYMMFSYGKMSMEAHGDVEAALDKVIKEREEEKQAAASLLFADMCYHHEVVKGEVENEKSMKENQK